MKMIYVPVLNQTVFGGRPTDLGDAQIINYRYVPRPKNADPFDQYYLAGITGNSLSDVHIVDGDWIMWRVTNVARKGQLVVIATPHGITMKFYHPRPDGTVRLLSAIKACKPQVWLASEITIRGVVVTSGRDWE